ncbi:hypothetical protein MPTK1_2g19150 [Marchantia polymorpha subsp. ruderalis]|uniref:Uncharacterized protein n=1 Tax=Marchantia polymorpha TaxID=3197 RepID=A0A2R6W8L5_MARPO|nr:hypothetical protein MARPO_0128s0028 [Marchantia polymorpha]BBN02904.1 hypothetical protein Mp_2g19150 [Marchantia polymorpha subsp. ruderalis]|eukprot:PTQ30206.1 hypothetical protein MARPO_0128s0028 [Marchantia polymorpha]
MRPAPRGSFQSADCEKDLAMSILPEKLEGTRPGGKTRSTCSAGRFHLKRDWSH